jgi:hypothetical protein
VHHLLLLPRQIVAIVEDVGLHDVVDDGRQRLAVVVHVEVLGAEPLDGLLQPEAIRAVGPDGPEPVEDDPVAALDEEEVAVEDAEATAETMGTLPGPLLSLISELTSLW